MKRQNEPEDPQTPTADYRPPKRRHLSSSEVQSHFRADLFSSPALKQTKTKYANSQPYKHGVISSLLQPGLLKQVRYEIQSTISFTPKETDIYRIHQSGDLANLDGLPAESLRLLPSLVTLRDALYSADFRGYLSEVTGAGALSGERTDMAVNLYTPGCHLLCHDDVIGTRRVSYILYLTDPDKPWRKEWGGALRLYPTREVRGADGRTAKMPAEEYTVAIPPAFNQLSFFAVQPGESFHDVEEVYARSPCKPTEEANGNSNQNGSIEEDDGGDRIRMAISGWYHVPQRGEPNYSPSDQENASASSLAQLQSQSDTSFDLPQLQWHDPLPNPSPQTPFTSTSTSPDLTEHDLTHLLHFLNPRYLTPQTVSTLRKTFTRDSSLRLALFLNSHFASTLKPLLSTSPSSALTTSLRDSGWQTARPPHKHRHLFQSPSYASPSELDTEILIAQDPLKALHSALLPSLPFRKWLALATGLPLTSCATLARRFRRGMDYALATGYDDPRPRVEACLGITPSAGWGGDWDEDGDGAAEPEGGGAAASAGAMEKKPTDTTGSAPPDEHSVGGYEAYMSSDPDPLPGEHATRTGAGSRGAHDPAVYDGGGGGEDRDEDDGILFAQPAGWNTLSVVLRDRGTLRFVKYLSGAARGDRWDVCGWWGVEEGFEFEGLGSGSEGDGEGSEESGDEDEDEGDEDEDEDEESE